MDALSPNNRLLFVISAALIVSVVFEMSNGLKNPHSCLQNARLQNT